MGRPSPPSPASPHRPPAWRTDTLASQQTPPCRDDRHLREETPIMKRRRTSLDQIPDKTIASPPPGTRRGQAASKPYESRVKHVRHRTGTTSRCSRRVVGTASLTGENRALQSIGNWRAPPSGAATICQSGLAPRSEGEPASETRSSIGQRPPLGGGSVAPYRGGPHARLPSQHWSPRATESVGSKHRLINIPNTPATRSLPQGRAYDAPAAMS